MVTLFITALAIVFIIAIGFYFLLRSTPKSGERVLPPNPGFYGLFGADPADNQAEKKKIAAAARETKALSLLDRARRGDVSALADANRNGERTVYDQVLNELVAQAGGNAGLLSLMSYIAQNELPVNRTLAIAVVASWKESPDRGSTAKALHFAALSDDADVYRETVESALQFWRARKLARIPVAELRALFEGEFWILSSRTRSSGAGFVLKRTLDKARRELETAQNNESTPIKT